MTNTATADPLHMREKLNSDFSFRAESDDEGLIEQQLSSINQAVSKEDWYKVSAAIVQESL